MNHTVWLNKLFNSFVDYSDDIETVFEEKEKLKSDKIILNLSVHPIKFADDIFFNFETNNNKLRAKLKKYEVNYDMFYAYADVVKATYVKSVKKMM